MNTKFYVPFETAKMLKKAGYPQSGSDMYYNSNGELVTRAELEAGYNEEYPIMITYYYAAPAYCEVLDWMISKKIAVITIEMFEIMWNIRPIDEAGMTWCCYVRLNDTIVYTDYYNTRWEAINAAIIRALKE